jgi:hypothetical protein
MDIGEDWVVPFTYILLNTTISVLPNPTLMFFFIDEHTCNCVGWDTVEINNNNYDALKLSGNFGTKNDIWYSQVVGNIIKLDFNDIDLGYGSMLDSLDMILKSTTYEIDTLPPLVPEIPGGDLILSVGVTAEYSAQTTDPDDDIIRYIFDWGDGKTDQTDFIPSGVTINLSHTWAEKGIYDIRVKARDIYGAESDWSEPLSVTVENNNPEKPSIPDGPTNGKIQESYTYQTSSTDVDGHKIKYYFDWGDGKNSWTNFIDSGEIVSASHVFTEQGIFEIKVKAVDEYGAESDWSDSISVTMPKNKLENILINLIEKFIEKHQIISLIFKQFFF